MLASNCTEFLYNLLNEDSLKVVGKQQTAIVFFWDSRITVRVAVTFDLMQMSHG